MATIINTKLGTNSKGRRVWLEGQKLAREGYQPGMQYDVDAQGGKLVLTVRENGAYRVSRRTRNGRTAPIIDINSQELAALFDGVETLRVAIKQGRIVISAHHQQGLVNERVERLEHKLAEGVPLSVCSLFHGGGVLDKAIHAGLKQAGVDAATRIAVELEGKYLDASLANNPELWDENSIAIESPVQDVNLHKQPSAADILVGGIPCTGASKSGRSKNALEFAESHDAAGAMFFSFLEFTKAVNPAVVIIENVPEYQNTASMVVIRSVLSTLGYNIQERLLDGPEFGALERRQRLCVVALSEGLDTHFDLGRITGTQAKPAAFSDILEPVALDSKRWKRFDYLADKAVRDKAAGKGFARQLLTGAEASCGTIGQGYAKCRSTEPFLMHPEDSALSRIFTPAEHARVKGVPESVIKGVSDTVAHQILGQSVIFPAFEAVAAHLGQHLSASVHTSIPAAA